MNIEHIFSIHKQSTCIQKEWSINRALTVSLIKVLIRLWERVGRFTYSKNSRLDDFCNGAKKRFKILLDLVNDFKKMYENEKNTITFMHYVENSHNTNDRFNWVDDDLFNFFKDGYQNKLFENTAIFLFSDHGIRFTDKRSSHNRYLEERMPFFAIYLPEEYKSQNPLKINNLKENTNHLTSPFDIYATVRELTNLEPLIDTKENPELKRSISLLNKISIKRNCEHIGISDHYCICAKNWTTENNHDKTVIKAAEYSINVINKLTSLIRNLCLRLYLQQIISAEFLIEDNQRIYRIQFITRPNNGVYETLLYDSYLKDFEFSSDEFSIKSRNEISRIDAYGDQPHCVSNFDNNPEYILDLRKFCFCEPRKKIKKSSIK